MAGPDSDAVPPPAPPAASGPARARPPAIRRSSSTGPVLPDITSDERDVGWGEVPPPDDDERLRGEVPPHHGS